MEPTTDGETLLPSKLVTKHVAATSLVFLHIQYCAFGWCNKFSTQIEKCTEWTTIKTLMSETSI
jgi:hypothetical protein